MWLNKPMTHVYVYHTSWPSNLHLWSRLLKLKLCCGKYRELSKSCKIDRQLSVRNDKSIWLTGSDFQEREHVTCMDKMSPFTNYNLAEINSITHLWSVIIIWNTKCTSFNVTTIYYCKKWYVTEPLKIFLLYRFYWFLLLYIQVKWDTCSCDLFTGFQEQVTITALQSKTQYLHFRSHAEYLHLSWKISEVMSRRLILFHN